MVDYRVVALGAVAPLAEAIVGGPRVLHTLLGAVGILTVVMMTTQKSRLVRRRLLGIPIGLLLHLVLDGTWLNQSLLWWPAFGRSFGSGQVPELDRSPVVIVVLELFALGVGFWAWQRYRLGDSDNRALLVSTGQLSREVLQ